MSRPDKIFLAISGDPIGERLVGNLQPPKGTHDTLKLTRAKHGIVRAGHVVGGLEDCLDVNNHCEEMEVSAEMWEPKGKYLATLKGGSRDITLRGPVIGHGSEVDIDIGNHSDQSDDPTTDVKLDLLHVSKEPIYVRVLNGYRPRYLNEHEQKYIIVFKLPGFWRKLFAKAYGLLKRLGVPI